MCQLYTDAVEVMDEHLALLSSISLSKYQDISNFCNDQGLKNTPYIEILRDRRKRLTPAQRRIFPTIKTTGKLWRYPFAIERQYRAWLTSKMEEHLSAIAIPVITRNMPRWVDEYNAQNTADSALTTDQYTTEVDALINALRSKQNMMFNLEQESLNSEFDTYASLVSEQNQVEFEKFQRVAIGTTFQPQEPWIRGTVTTWVTNNRNLLRGMSDEYIKKLEFNIASGFQDGLTSSSIIKNIRKMDSTMTRTRANLLGRDQIGKLNAIYSKNRAQQAGLTMYVWLTAGDERVRDTHKGMDNTVNKWEDTSVFSKDNGKTFTSRPGAMQGAIPGSQIQCRCTQKPFFDELIGNIDKELETQSNGDI